MYIYKIGLRQNYLHKYDTLRRSKQETTSFEKFHRVVLFMCFPLNVLCRVLLFRPERLFKCRKKITCILSAVAK